MIRHVWSVLVVVASVAALSACTSPPVIDHVTVSGDEGVWLQNSYASGVGETYTPGGTICSVADGIIVTVSGGAFGSASAIDLTSRTSVWTTPQGACFQPNSSLVVDFSTGSPLDQSDGSPIVTPPATETLTVPVAETDSDVLFTTMGATDALIAVDRETSTVSWRVEIPRGGIPAVACDTNSAVVVCFAAGDEYLVVDTKSGTVVASGSGDEGAPITLLADGFVVAGDKVATVYDNAGKRLGEVSTPDGSLPGSRIVPHGPLFPAAFLSTADALKGADALVVARDGTVVPAKLSVTFDGKKRETEPRAISADGKTALLRLVPLEGEPDGMDKPSTFVIADVATTRVIADFSAVGVNVMGGLIVTGPSAFQATAVVPPAG